MMTFESISEKLKKLKHYAVMIYPVRETNIYDNWQSVRVKIMDVRFNKFMLKISIIYKNDKFYIYENNIFQHVKNLKELISIVKIRCFKVDVPIYGNSFGDGYGDILLTVKVLWQDNNIVKGSIACRTYSHNKGIKDIVEHLNKNKQDIKERLGLFLKNVVSGKAKYVLNDNNNITGVEIPLEGIIK